MMRLFTWLLIGAVVFRGMIPAGYMPQAARDGRLFTMVICTATGSETIAVNAHGQPMASNHNTPENPDPQKQTGHKAPCFFGVGTSVIISSHATAPLIQLQGYAAPVFSAPASHPAMAVLRKTAPPRAPPLFS
ncbi:MAG: DUF2946 family protein [Alphaproteobacteria bacterium]